MLCKSFIISVLCCLGYVLGAAVTPPASYNGSCHDAKPILCDNSFWQWSENNQGLSQLNYDFTGYSNPGVTYDGADQIYILDAGHEPTSMTITLSGNSSDLDLLVFGACRNLSSPKYSACLGLSVNRHNGGEKVTLNNVSGELYIIVDGPHKGIISNFELAVQCTPDTPEESNSSDPFSYLLEDCSSGIDVSCGESIWVSSMNNNSFNLTNYDLSGCHFGGFTYDGHDQIFYIDAGNTKKNVTIQISELKSDLDVFLFKKCESYAGRVRFTGCIDRSYNSGNSDEKIEIPDAIGQYVLVVDGFSEYINSSYRLSVDCREVQSFTSCRDARQLYCGSSLLVQASKHSSLNAEHYNFSSCFTNYQSYTGQDHLYRIDVDHGKRQDLEIEIDRLHGDLDLFVFLACDAVYNRTSLNQCAAYSISSGKEAEKVVIKDAQGTYYIAVDSRDPWVSSSYSIRVECIEKQIDLCLYASTLSCGQSRWVAAPHINQVVESNYDYSSCTSFKNHGYRGYDHIYQIDAGLWATDLVIGIDGLFANLDVLVFKECRTQLSEYSFRRCVGYGMRGGHEAEEVVIKDAVGRYYIVIDAPSTASRTGYQISVDCRDPKQSFDCSDAQYMTCGDEIWSDSPIDNNMTTHNYSTSICTNYTDIYVGADHLYAIDVGPRAKDITIEMSGLSADLDLLLFSVCGESHGEISLEQCKGYSNLERNDSEVLYLEGAIGTYYVAVDAAKDWYRSSYKLAIACEEFTQVEEAEEEEEVEHEEVEEEADEEVDEDEDVDQEDEADHSDEALVCGGTIRGSTIGGTSSYGATQISACFESNLLFTGPDVLIPFEVGDTTFSLIMTHEEANLSLFVLDSNLNFLSTGCRGLNYSSDGTVSNGDIVGEVYSPDGAVAPGTYYALIDGYISRIASDFTLSLSCGNGCTSNTSLSCESLVENISGTDNQEMIYSLSDGSQLVGFTGPEWSAEILIDTMADISIFVHNVAGDGQIGVFLRDGCGEEVLAHTISESSDVSLEANVSSGTYLLTIDGWQGADMTYDIEVSGCADNTAAAAVSLARSSSNTSNITALDVSVNPNPFIDQTRLSISSATDDSGSLRIFSFDGRLVSEQTLHLAAGDNNVILYQEDFGGYTGIMVYRLTVGDQIVQGKMMRIE